jgi:multicomponent Na+:H+ antiporter subunit F
VIGDVIFYVGIGWLAVLLGVTVVLVARSPSTPSRILALDLLTLILIGLLALAAGEDRRSFALDAALALALLSFVGALAACRLHEDRRPFT